jgi:hypothetical protein
MSNSRLVIPPLNTIPTKQKQKSKKRKPPPKSNPDDPAAVSEAAPPCQKKEIVKDLTDSIMGLADTILFASEQIWETLQLDFPESQLPIQ